MSLLKLFRFFRPIHEEPPQAEQPTPAHVCTAAPLLSIETQPLTAPVYERLASPIEPFTGTRYLQAWLCKGDGSFPTQVHGESFYLREIALAIGNRKPWNEECVFRVALLPERNIHDKNAVAIYRVDGGQVGHLTRDCARRWRPVIDELLAVSGQVPACAATAGCSYEGGPIGIMLDITLPAIREQLARRKNPG